MTPPPRSRGPGDGEEPSQAHPPTAIGDALSSFVRSRGLQSGAGLARILPVWDEVVGSDIARHAQPVLLRANELVCEVDDAAWATQLRLLGQQILDQLSAAIGERVAEQLSVRVARRPRGS